MNISFYVDDCLKSLATPGEAISLVGELRKLLANRGFKVHKWISSDLLVIRSIPESEYAPSIKGTDLNGPLPHERVLGIRWSVDEDAFCFKIALPERGSTKRGMLSVIRTMFDTCGTVAPVTLPAKILVQQLNKMKLGWDDNIPEPVLHEWSMW